MHALRKDETRCSNSHIETGSSTSQWLRRIGHRPLRPHLSGCNCWRGPRRSARPQAKTPFAPRHDKSSPAGRESPDLYCCRPSGLRTASTFAFPGRCMTARVLPDAWIKHGPAARLVPMTPVPKIGSLFSMLLGFRGRRADGRRSRPRPSAGDARARSGSALRELGTVGGRAQNDQGHAQPSYGFYGQAPAPLTLASSQQLAPRGCRDNPPSSRRRRARVS